MGVVSDIVAGASQLSIINGVVGLVTGLVGSAMNLTVEYFKVKENNRHKEAIAHIDLQTMQNEIIRSTEVLNMQSEALAESNNFKMYVESVKHDLTRTQIDSGYGVFIAVIVDAVKQLVRPLLTVVTLYYVIVFANQLLGMLHSVTQEQILVVFNRCIDALIFLSTASFSWWFGVRMVSKK
jgi:hypothetical protein